MACLSRGHITSSISPAFLARRIEKFGLKRFIAHAETVSEGQRRVCVLVAMLC